MINLLYNLKPGFQHGMWGLFFWSGVCEAENGVGVRVTNCLMGKVVGVERCNESDEGQ